MSHKKIRYSKLNPLMENQQIITYHIKENTILARLSAYNLKKKRCAVVIGATIYLWGITKENFLLDEPYLKHEQQHILQYKELGIIRFLFYYMIESYRNGYYNNRFEIEARAAELKAHDRKFLLS